MSRHHLAISRQRTQRSCDIFINQLVKKKKTFKLQRIEIGK
jgi:hypothetical protein